MTFEVEMRDVAFVPTSITINRGDTVRWTSREEVAHLHTVTSGTPGASNAGGVFDSGQAPGDWLRQGDSFSFTFIRSGTFQYHCFLHRTEMRGTIIVN